MNNEVKTINGYHIKDETARQNIIETETAIENRSRTNSYFNKNLGCTTFFRNLNLESLQTQMSNIQKYFSCFKQQVRLTFNTSTMQYDLVEADNMENQISIINQAIQNGADFKGLHFYQTSGTTLQLIQTYGADVIMEAYYNAIVNFINRLPYKNEITTIWILNEVGSSVCSSTYKTDIIKLINDLQELGYEVSLPCAGAYNMMDYDKDILYACNFLSLNSYPKNDIYCEKSSISDVAERFNRDFRVIERYLQDKELCISEFGCSSSWNSFNSPEAYQEDRNGRPMALFLEGFFQSNLINYATKGIFLWYYADAYTYMPDTLLSVKNSREVRYNG